MTEQYYKVVRKCSRCGDKYATRVHEDNLSGRYQEHGCSMTQECQGTYRVVSETVASIPIIDFGEAGL